MDGAVVSLWRYPVKSMAGEEIEASDVAERGLLGDRGYALIDRETGKVGSAKHAKKWPGMLDAQAAYVEPPRPGEDLPPIRITLPDGTEVRSDEHGIDDALSSMIGRPVTLSSIPPEDAKYDMYWADVAGAAPSDDQRDTYTEEPIGIASPPGTFFDAAPLMVVTTTTLDHLTALYPEGRFEVRRFRPNIVVGIEDAQPNFVENAWVGGMLAVGDEVRLPVVAPDPRCVMTTLAQGDLPKDPGILRTAAQHNRIDVLDFGRHACVGVYALVAAGGTIRRGDRVAVEVPAAAA